MDDFIRSAVRHTPERKLESILYQNPRLAGQSVWNYVAERYGYASLQNVLNLTRITRDEGVGLSSSLNVPEKVFMRNWYTHYFQQNDQPPQPYLDVPETALLKAKNRRGLLYTEAVFSPDGARLAYVANDQGVYRVRVREIATGKERQLLRGGYKTPDQQVDIKMPLLAWRSNQQLAVVEVRRGAVELRLKTLSGKGDGEEGVFYRFKRAIGLGGGSPALASFAQVLDLQYSDDGKQLAFSAVRGSQSDIYLLRAGSRRPEQLTNDVYDDLHPVFLKGENALVFASNRPADSTGTDRGSFNRVVDNFDLFRRSLAEGTSRAPLRQLTSGIANETRPRALEPGVVAYLNEESGIRTAWTLDLRTGTRQPLTGGGENLKTFDLNGATRNLVTVFADRGREFVAVQPAYAAPAGLTLSKTVRQQTLEDRAARAARAAAPAQPAPPVAAAADSAARRQPTTPASPTGPAKTPAVGINTDNYQFDAEPVRPRARRAPLPVMPAPPPTLTNIAGPVPYDIRFSTTDVVTSLYADPQLGTGLVGEVQMADMLENHRIRAGAFTLTDFRTNNVYGEYAYLARRYDLRLNYQKSVYLAQDEVNQRRLSRNAFSASVIYPLTHALSVRVSPEFVRTLSTITTLLDAPDTTKTFGGGTAEIVFDNSIVTGLNQLEGSRIKFGVLRLQGLNDKNASFGKLYLDARHYQKIHRQLIWATRAAFGSFFGPSPKQFILGGVDNWLGATYADGGFRVPASAPELFYQQFVLPVRGFSYSERRGPKYVLFNTELRLPIVQYLAGNHPIESGFFRNLQLVGFFDAGAVYAGRNPFTTDNSFNTTIVKNGPFTATVTNFRSPFLVGYGAGARTTLLGFYGKFDVAWGELDGARLKPRYYFSLGYDF